jgi:hypothetical protein
MLAFLQQKIQTNKGSCIVFINNFAYNPWNKFPDLLRRLNQLDANYAEERLGMNDVGW